jgi:hypothetical protein
MSEHIDVEELKKVMAIFKEEVEQIEQASLDDQNRDQRVTASVLQTIDFMLQMLRISGAPKRTTILICPHNSCQHQVKVTLQVGSGSTQLCPHCNNAVDISLAIV